MCKSEVDLPTKGNHREDIEKLVNALSHGNDAVVYWLARSVGVFGAESGQKLELLKELHQKKKEEFQVESKSSVSALRFAIESIEIDLKKRK